MVSSHNILSFNCSHDAAVCHLKDGKVEWFIEEERVSRKKHDHRPYLSLVDGVRRLDDIDLALHTTLHHSDDPTLADKVLDVTCELIQKVKDKPKLMDCSAEHHLHHAALAFYNSGFEEAACLIVDGAGAYVEGGGHEVETIYKASYPHSFEKLHQKAVAWYTGSKLTESTIGIGFVYAGVSAYLGFGSLNCGKTMGLAPYGKFNPDIPSFLIEGEIDETLWERDPSGIILKPLEHVPSVERNELHDIHSDLAWRVQKDFETYMINLINKAIDLGQSKNIVLSGGCALNCVANYEYLKHLPEGYKLYVEPCSTDSGTSVGMAMYAWRKLTGSTEIYPIKDLYWGPKRDEYCIL